MYARRKMMRMKKVATVAWLFLMGLCTTAFLSPSANASLCQTVGASTVYPHSALPDRRVSIVTTVAGSCTSDGEDYFAVRVDLVDGVSKAILSSNSTPIGYNANNFTVNVRNSITSPKSNQSWPIDVDTYLVQAGGTSGKYLLNSTAIAIQVGEDPLPEFRAGPLLILTLALTGLLGTLGKAKSEEEINCSKRTKFLEEVH